MRYIKLVDLYLFVSKETKKEKVKEKRAKNIKYSNIPQNFNSHCVKIKEERHWSVE